MKQILLYVAAFAILSVSSTHAQDGAMVTSMAVKDVSQKPSKEETGIMSTLVNIYQKCRTSVQYAYDEIQYWKGVKNSYENLKKWFVATQEVAQHAKSVGNDLLHKDASAIEKLRMAEALYDDCEYIRTAQMMRLSMNLEDLEKSWDKFASPTIIPNTNEACNYTSQFFYDKSYSDLTKPGASEKAAYLAELKAREVLMAETDPRKRVVLLSREIVTRALANSVALYGWSQTAAEQYQKIDVLYEGAQSIPQLELVSTWYMIEQANANNKRIEHELLALKVYNAMLGVGIFDLAYMNEGKRRLLKSYDMMGAQMAAASAVAYPRYVRFTGSAGSKNGASRNHAE